MNYSCDGSGAYTKKVADAFVNEFCFRSAVYDSYKRDSRQIVMQNIDYGWPELIGGCRIRKLEKRIKIWKIILWEKYVVDGCHMWVCDGYEIRETDYYSTLYFHMNWGWNEVYTDENFNGWYLYNLWQPYETNRNYQHAQDMVYNIYP